MFWEKRKDVCKGMQGVVHFGFNNTPTSRPPVEGDSDEDEESEESENELPAPAEDDAERDGWRMNTDFVAPNITELYDHVFSTLTRARQRGRNHSSLKVANSTVNSPMKAWGYLFTDPFLHKIVSYTNDYGNENYHRWVDIDVSDLKDFLAIIFIAGVQKRKDNTQHWWSNDPYFEFPLAKKIMSGKKFHMMLRYLHVCDLHHQPSIASPTYSPLYKVQEFMDYLTHRAKMAFEAGPSLSLDETLVRTFGRIKFKVRIISKAARYGIKIYVLADAETSYVLQVLVYTGQYTYFRTSDDDEETKKPSRCVKSCASPIRDHIEWYSLIGFTLQLNW
jgi:hypothetical protein